MERKDFFKNICKYGACGCAGMMLLSPANLLANDDNTEEKKEDKRIGFVQRRMAKLIEDMEGKIDNETLAGLLEDMGKNCAQEYSDSYIRFKGDIEGYVNSIKQWVDTAEYDEEKGIVKIVGVKNNSCFCPFVDITKMPKEFCNCTKGWNIATYGTITGKQVEVKIDETVLWGSDRCSFTITLT